MAVLIEGMQGFGDNIYQRAFCHGYSGHYIRTPFPELYEDLGLKCVKPRTRLRTQLKNVEASEYNWHKCPAYVNIVKVGYGNQLGRGSMVDAMARQFRRTPVFDLPKGIVSPVTNDKPIAVVRPSTLRKEWLNVSRAPLPEYICEASYILKERGYHIVSVADVDGENEWIDGEPPYADEVFHNGELSFMQLLGLVKDASIVVGGVGWIVPACISANTRAYFILGGNGGHNSPEKVTSPLMDLSKIGWAIPDKFCMCTLKEHDCNKTIGGFGDGFKRWLDS